MIRQKVYRVLLTREFRLTFRDPELEKAPILHLEQLNKDGKRLIGVFMIRDEGYVEKRFAIFEWEEKGKVSKEIVEETTKEQE